MRNYLEGYLDVLPQGQSNKVQDVLKATRSSIDAGIVTEAEFKELVRKIAEDHQELTEYIPQVDRVDDSLHNAFFSKVATDINLMYSESQLIEHALNSYDRLYDGILGDLSKEIKSLRERINSLRLVAEGENGLIVKTVDFSNSASVETDREKFAYLFKDRDGSNITDAVIERIGDVSYVGLNKDKSKDRVRDASGNPVAVLAKIDYRGTPIEQSAYPTGNAIDNSPDSYWGEVVMVDEPVNVGMDKIEAGGALIKLTVTLPRPEIVTEIALTPFTNFPVEICSVKYEEDIETYHIPKELVKQKTENTQTMIFQFPSIIAKRFTIILRQKNYVKDTYLLKESSVAKADLWDKVSKRETEMTLNNIQGVTTVDQAALDTYSGWNIYETELKKYEDAHAAWMVRFAAYQEYRTKIQSYNERYGTSY